MVASRLILSFLVEIIVIGSLGWWVLGLSVPASLALAAASIVIVRVVITLLSFVLSEIFRSPRSESMRIGVRGWLRLIYAELCAMFRVFFVLHPLEPWINKADPGFAQEDNTPVILVHGFFSNGGFWWEMKRFLSRNGVRSVYTINLEPPFGDINQLARQLAKRISAICENTGKPRVILVAHSMGGLVCRAYLQRYEGDRYTDMLVTLGTPNAGTVHARLLPVPNLCQIRPGNDWLTELNRLQGAATTVPTVCIYSSHDNIIVPQDSGALIGAANKPIRGIGHLEMAFSSAIQQLVLEVLDSLDLTNLANNIIVETRVGSNTAQ